jgi:ABC-type Fe3+-hydroxamate transport system substrate-binding protein
MRQKMKKNKILKKMILGRSWRSASLYFICIAFVFLWWFVFFSEPVKPHLPAPPAREELHLENYLSRKELIKALQGDFSLMGQMILRWDVEAQAQQTDRLPAEKVLRAHYLAQTIPLSPHANPLKILPQTYSTAGILLAITSPKELVALPRGLREQKELYPIHLTAQIPLDVDNYTTEKLYLAHPDIALVSSHYSHPSALQALANQGIPVKASPHCETIQDVMREIEMIGLLIGHTAEAELLKIFMDAAFLKLDQLPKNTSSTLFLSYYDHFYIPKESTITGALIQRAGLVLPKVNPVELKEHLLQNDPETLIIAVPPNVDLIPLLQKDAGYANLRAVRSGRVRFINDEIMQTPTHFSVLAYYDLVEALRP